MVYILPKTNESSFSFLPKCACGCDMYLDRHHVKSGYEKKYKKGHNKRLNIFNISWVDKNECAKKYRIIYKEKLFDILGGKKCVKCGFADERALQFDHINGDGHEYRKKHGHFGHILSMYIKDPNIKSKLQVLCANCNWIKRVENNEIRRFSS